MTEGKRKRREKGCKDKQKARESKEKRRAKEGKDNRRAKLRMRTDKTVRQRRNGDKRRVSIIRAEKSRR